MDESVRVQMAQGLRQSDSQIKTLSDRQATAAAQFQAQGPSDV